MATGVISVPGVSEAEMLRINLALVLSGKGIDSVLCEDEAFRGLNFISI